MALDFSSLPSKVGMLREEGARRSSLFRLDDDMMAADARSVLLRGVVFLLLFEFTRRGPRPVARISVPAERTRKRERGEAVEDGRSGNGNDGEKGDAIGGRRRRRRGGRRLERGEEKIVAMVVVVLTNFARLEMLPLVIKIGRKIDRRGRISCCE